MNKSTLVGSAVVLIILAGVVGYAATRQPGSQGPATAADGVIAESGKYYTIEAHYPTATPLASLPDSAQVNAIALMKQWELDTIAGFKTDSGVMTLTPEDIQIQNLDADGGRQYALDITYTATTSAQTVSYVYLVYEDTLGAHPNGFYHIFSFDTATGQNLALKDLFAPGAPYLKTLSDIAKARLPQMIADAEQVDVADVDTTANGMLAAGITPTEDNYADFEVTPTDLVIIFPPYQIGPWALGTVTLPIPKSDLPDLKPAYK